MSALWPSTSTAALAHWARTDGSSQTLIDLNALRERFDELKGLVEQCDKQKEVISLLRRELDTRIGHQVDVEERARSLEATLSNTLTQLDNAVQRYGVCFRLRLQRLGQLWLSSGV